MSHASRILGKIVLRWRARGIGYLGKGVSLSRSSILKNRSQITIGDGTWIDDMAYLNGTGRGGVKIGSNCQIRFSAYIDCWKGKGISIGNNVFIGPFTIVQGQGGIEIGSDSLIGGHCFIVSSSHVFSDPDVAIREQGEESLGVTIEDDVWIGAGTVVLDGVRIGKGSVIGAGSVVTKSIPPYSVAYGIPARQVRKRSGASEEGP